MHKPTLRRTLTKLRFFYRWKAESTLNTEILFFIVYDEQRKSYTSPNPVDLEM
jgi:hypothetical protein